MARISTVRKQEKTIDRRQVRQHFSCHAREYDRYARVQQSVAENLMQLLLTHQQAWRQGLEVGCGTGQLSRRLVRHFPALPMVFTDLAHGMSQQTRLATSTEQICDADAAALPFLRGAFDLLVSSSVYQWLEDLPAAFAEAGRVLQPGGLFAVALFGEKTLYELRESHQSALGENPSHSQQFASLTSVSEALQGEFEPLLLRSDYEVEWHASVPQLLKNLKRIGAQNASSNRPQGLASRKVMQQMSECYQRNFAAESGVPATYEVIYLLARRRAQQRENAC